MDITTIPTTLWDSINDAAMMLAKAIVAVIKVIFLW